MPSPKITILTPNLNGGKLVKGCVESVRAQNFADCEHLIMDGGSTDESLSYFESCNDVKIISRNDAGSHDALDKGVMAANGEVICFLNTDDHLLPEALNTAWSVFEANPDVDAVCCSANFYHDGEIEAYMQSRRVQDSLRLKELAMGLPCFNAWFVRTRVCREAGSFDASIDYSGDRDFLIRVYFAGNVVSMDFPAYGYLVHEGSRTMNSIGDSILPSMFEHMRMIDSYLSGYTMTFAQRAVMYAWHAQVVARGILLSVQKGLFVEAIRILASGTKSSLLWPLWLIYAVKCRWDIAGYSSRPVNNIKWVWW